MSWPPPHRDNTELGMKFSMSSRGVFAPTSWQERSFQREPCPEVGLLLCQGSFTICRNEGKGLGLVFFFFFASTSWGCATLPALHPALMLGDGTRTPSPVHPAPRPAFAASRGASSL